MNQVETQLSPDAIIELVTQARAKGMPEAQIPAHLTIAGLSSAQAAHAIEMFDFAMNHAFADDLGMAATTDYDNDPIFRAALKAARKILPIAGPVRAIDAIKPCAIGVAILIGVLALGALAYEALSLWRASN